MKRILLTGKTGQLGWELQHTLKPVGEIIATDRSQLDLTKTDTIRKAIRDIAPDIIVNAAGYTTVDNAETEREIAYQVNAVAPGIIAEEAARARSLLVHYSTDYVYDGTKQSPYTEADSPNPVNFYGNSKLDGEQAIAASGCKHLILRASWIYSNRGTNFVRTMMRLAQEKNDLSVVTDQIGCPSWARFLAVVSAEILLKNNGLENFSGTYHLSATGHVARFDFAQSIIALAKQFGNPGSKWAQLHPIKTIDFPLPARRPLYVATSKNKLSERFGVSIPSWQIQLESFMKNVDAQSTSTTVTTSRQLRP